MAGGGRPPIWRMLQEAVEDLGSPTTNVAVCDWVQERYPGTNRGSVQCQIVICTVNHPSRVHYPENEKPRVADDSRYDFLYRSGRGQLERYDPERHGVWQIAHAEDGSLSVCRQWEVPEARAPRTEASGPPSLAIPLLPSQIEAANRLHHRLPGWSATDAAFEALRQRLPGFERDAALLKAAILDRLYRTNVLAIVLMAQHIVRVMADPPDDPVELVTEIATLPLKDGMVHHHWSFASKFVHFFIDSERVPIHDSYANLMVARHLGGAGRIASGANPYRAFFENVRRLRQLAGLSCSLRELDRYLWLAGQYCEWVRSEGNAALSGEVVSLFEEPSAEARKELAAMLPEALDRC